jgi:hypothetical protein
MGLDIYAGSLIRYVAGDWLTVVQQAGQSSGMPVEVVRINEPPDAIRDPEVVRQAVISWQQGLLRSLGISDAWDDDAEMDYRTDKPDWDGYGAVVLTAAYDEHPDLSPGMKVRSGIRSKRIEATEPRKFPESDAFRAASQSPSRYPTLLGGAEWCLPLASGPTVFRAPAPNGTELTMGRVDRLHTELTELNSRTLRLSPQQLSEAMQAGPPEPSASVDRVAPFGLAVLTALADYAFVQSVPWIMDY